TALALAWPRGAEVVVVDRGERRLVGMRQRDGKLALPHEDLEGAVRMLLVDDEVVAGAAEIPAEYVRRGVDFEEARGLPLAPDPPLPQFLRATPDAHVEQARPKEARVQQLAAAGMAQAPSLAGRQIDERDPARSARGYGEHEPPAVERGSAEHTG